MNLYAILHFRFFQGIETIPQYIDKQPADYTYLNKTCLQFVMTTLKLYHLLPL